MTKITTDFNGSEDVATVQTRLEAIADFWLGSGSLSAATTWGDVRAALNGVADTANQIGNLELASSFIDKLNWLNETDNIAADPDAVTYIRAVQTADGAGLEPAVRAAIDAFVTGCKSDGIWDAIKASCIMAGARTLAGALVPLKGAAPTNFNFVSGDYDRKTGLVGDGATKYLDSNRAGNADPQNSKHMSVFYKSGSGTLIGGGGVNFANRITTPNIRINQSVGTGGRDISAVTGLIAGSRADSSSFSFIVGSSIGSHSAASGAPISQNALVFAQNLSTGPSDPSATRLSFYSIGEAIDLAALDTRVSALMTAIDGAIA
jgi:hypothetical protein